MVSSSLVTKTVSSFESQEMNIHATCSETSNPHHIIHLQMKWPRVSIDENKVKRKLKPCWRLFSTSRTATLNQPDARVLKGEDESHTLTKDIDDILAKVKEGDTLKENGVKPSYPLWMDYVPFLTKFKQPIIEIYIGKVHPGSMSPSSKY